MNMQFLNAIFRNRWFCSLFLAVLSGMLCQSAIAANWYIDNAVSSSGNGQSWSTAWKQFSNIVWSSVTPGDTIYISGGTTSKTYTGGLVVGKSGTSNTSRITVRAGQDAGHNGIVILDRAGLDASNLSWVTFDGEYQGSRHIRIQNVTDASKDNGWAIGASGSTGLIVRYIETTGCNNGIYGPWANQFEFAYNSITSKGDAGIRTIISNANGFDQNRIHHNTIESIAQAGAGPDGLQPGSSTSIYNNTFVVTRGTPLPGQHPDMIQIAGSYIKIYNNTFLNIADSHIDYDMWSSGSLLNVYIYNNLFQITQQIDDYPDFIRIYSTGAAVNSFNGLKILNNTFVDARPAGTTGSCGQLMGFGFGNGSGAGSGNEIRNNLKIGSPCQMQIHTDSGGGSWSVAWSNNVYPYAMSVDTSETIGVPQLDANYVPTSSDTIARDRGISMSAYFTADKLGTPRPQGSAWDIGAFEYSSSGTSALSPPTNLRIQ